MTTQILLIDDHAIVRDGLAFFLNAQPGFQVVGAASEGRQALTLCQQLHPAVVVMDISMPDLNGIEATRLIHQDSPEIAIIILSMHSSSEYIYRSFQAGAAGYVLKESAGSELVSAVAMVVAGNRYLSPVLFEQMSEFQGLLSLKSPLESLSSREVEVLHQVVQGRSSQEIANALLLSVKTVETYRSRLMQKLGVNDIPALVRFAILHGLTPLN
jgi:DNA-binding NarL/FixJ family response regulator